MTARSTHANIGDFVEFVYPTAAIKAEAQAQGHNHTGVVDCIDASGATHVRRVTDPHKGQTWHAWRTSVRVVDKPEGVDS